MRKLIDPLVMPILRYATRSYVPGPLLQDAMDLAGKAAARDFDVTIAYWSDGKEAPRSIVERYKAALDAIAASDFDGCLSVKIPFFWEQFDLVEEVVGYARDKSVRIMFDSHAPETMDQTFTVLDRVGPEGVGLAIPGRWRRSTADAERTLARGARIRVVKGQWADPEDPDADMRAGFLNVVDRICDANAAPNTTQDAAQNTIPGAGVATHDADLAAEAIARLQKANVPCEQEFVYPLPIEKALPVGRAAGLRQRLYIPYGEAWLPYSVSRAFQDPSVVWRLINDLFTDERFRLPR